MAKQNIDIQKSIMFYMLVTNNPNENLKTWYHPKIQYLEEKFTAKHCEINWRDYCVCGLQDKIWLRW